MAIRGIQGWRAVVCAVVVVVLVATISGVAHAAEAVSSGPESSALAAPSAEKLVTDSSSGEVSVTGVAGVSGSEARALEEARASGGTGAAVGLAGKATGGSPESSGSPSVSFPLEGPLVIGGSPTEGEQLRAVEAARLASPEAVHAREVSELAYSGLNSTAGKELAGTTFPALVNEPNGGAPKLPEGARISSFSSEFSASLELSHGERGALESVAPIAVNTPSGTVPVNLTPQQSGTGFEAQTPAGGMHVRAGGKLSEGASLSDVGVTMTPVTEDGTPLEGNRSVDGASIFYGNSENAQAGVADTDSLIKFDTYGFSEETILRSDRAPQRLYFRVGLPEGASLVQPQHEPGMLQVVDTGQVIAQISAPSGRDAEGTSVPLTLSASGDMVTLNVEHQPGQYKFPIEADPTTYDTQVLAIHNGLTYQSRWKVGTSNGKEGPFYFSESINFGIRNFHGENTSPGYNAGEWGGFAYTTQGESAIYDVHVTSSLTDGGHGFEAQAKLTNKVKTGINEPSASHLDSYSEGSWPGWELCMLAGCAVPTEVTSEIAENSYSLIQFATRTGNYYIDAELWGAWVYIVQTKNSTVSFDTADPEVAGVPNALYGTEHWVRGAFGAVKGIAKDPGIGISELGFSSANESKWGISESFLYPNTALCQGVICPQEETRTVNLTGLPDGQDTVTFAGQNDTDTKAQAAKTSATVYVDNTAPHNIVLSGLPASKEVGGGEYKLTAEATDGTAPTPSSGMKSLTLLIDGKEMGSVPAACSPGPCTGHGTSWTIFGHNYATGRHTLTVNATDNAGNVGSESFAMIVHPTTPVAMGPGKVNPLSGEFSLAANDVSVSGLTVSRSYSSQHLTTGESGPVSAQWGFSLGGQESLVKQADGSMVLTDVTGGQTIFHSDGKGGYLSPPGDSNLTLSTTPCEAGQSEFMLKNAAAATTTCFKVPAGGTSEVWTPSIAKGAVATDTVTYAFESAEPHQARHEYSLPTGSKPFDVTTGPDGNVWFTDEGTSKIGKTTTAGTITEYALPAGSEPHGIVNGPDGNLWFSDRGSSKIGKITTGGVITEYALPTKSWPEHIAVGPDGNLWFVDKGTAKVGKITTAGVITEYALPATSEPEGITAGADGNLWFTNFINSKLAATIGKVTTSGVVTEYAAKSCPTDITSGPDGDLWFSNYCNNKIGKITTAGVITEYSLPEKSNPNGITTGPEGKLWFTDRFTSKVGSISTEGAIVEYTAGTSSEPEGIVTGPDKNLWFAEEAAGKIAMLAPPEPGAHAIIEPKEALAPVPAGVSCSPEFKPGCRALTFNYAESTTATGEAQSEWGDINGHLTRVYYTAYDPVSKAMKTVEVAHYLYDKQKRLRAEWDPRISPSLKTVYGYDSEGHITSVTAPGQETWAFTYGTTPGDESAGRALKAVQAPASAALWSGEGLKNSEAPRVSGSPVVGNRMTVSDGGWSGSPVAYAYRWEDCNSLGAECKQIAGATDANYTPTGSDLTHTLVVQVTATNGSGSLTVASSASSAVTATMSSGPASYMQTIDSGNSVNAVSCVPGTTDCVVSDSAGKAFYATNVSTGAAASWSSWSGPGTSPSEAVTCPSTSLCLLASGSKEGYGGTMYYATSLGGAWTEAYNPSYGVDAISCVSASFCVDGQDNYGYFRYSTSPASTAWNLEDQGNAAMKGVSCVSSSFCVIADGAGSVHVATSTTQIESSSWTETNVDGTTGLNGVACTSTTSCVAVDGAGNVLNLAVSGTGVATASKHDIDGTNSLAAVTCTGSMCAAVDGLGNIFISTNGGEGWTKQFAFGDKLTSVSCASSLLCLTADTAGKTIAFSLISEGSMPTYSSAFGSAGSGNGQFSGPWDVASNAAGDVYVADTSNNRVQEFGPEGVYVRQWGTSGTGNGQFKRPEGVAVDSKGNVWVADKENNRVEEFNGEGTFVRAFGSEGTGNGQLKCPEGLEVDSAGNVWVADHCNNRIEEFTGEGAFVRTVGSAGSGNGQLSYPGDVAIDSKRELIVADTSNNRIEEFTATGEYIRQFGISGTGVGQFNTPWRVSVGPEGYLWVSDSNNNRVQVFKATGEYVYQFGTAGSGEGHLSAPTGVSFYGSSAYVLDRGNNRVGVWRLPAPTYSSTFGSLGSGNGQFSNPWDVATDSAGRVWVADTGNSRIQEFGPEGYIRQWGSSGTGNGQFKGPEGVTVDSKGNVWVSDTGNNRVQEFTSEGTFIRAFGSEGTGNGQLKQPEGLRTDSKGYVWIADKGNSRVQEFTPEGSFVKTVGSAGSGNGQFSGPGDVAFDAKGDMWVTDVGNSRVQEFTPEGAFVRAFGSPGSGYGQFSNPWRLTIDTEENVWVTDTANNRIQVFSSTGEYKYQFGTYGSGSGQLNRPDGIALYGANVYVLDRENDRVAVWHQQQGNAQLVEGEARSPQPGTTVEYNVPLSGAGLPTMTSGEVEKWAQKDVPTEATAVFPPDEPQSWPASSYRRATIYYRDSTSRPVNVQTPGGGISTTEYNEHNDVTRSLSPDNRASALKETNPAAAAKLVDTQSEYNSEGTELLSTLGPRHTVKLANGKEAQARSHTVYSYDEGAPSEGGPYRLVTKTTQGAQIEGEAEQDVRTTATLHSGQNNLGWTLRKPTAVVADPSGLKLTHRTVYDPGTGNPVETRTPGASGPLPYLRYQSSWGTTGQPPIDRAEGVAIDKEGNIWVADTENNRLVELWSSGTLRRTVGSYGAENGQFNKPAGIAVDATGNVWVADTGNNRIQELSSTGTYIRQAGKYGAGNGEFKSPHGITVDSTGHVWVADTGNNRVQELSSEAVYVTQYGTQGTGNGQFNQPYAVAIDKEGNIWVGDSANGRIQELSSTGTYIRQFGREGNPTPCKEELGVMRCPSWWAEGIAIDAAGHVWTTESNKVEEFSSTGTAITHFGTFGKGEGQVEYPKGIAIDSENHVWLADTGNTRIQELSSTGAYVQQYPATPIPVVLNNPKGFARTSTGNWLLADTGNNRLQEATSAGSVTRQSFWRTKQTEGVGVDAKGAIWFSEPPEGMVSRDSSAMVPEYAMHGFGTGESFNKPSGIAFSGEKMYVTDRGNNAVYEFEKEAYVRKFGSTGSGSGQLSEPHGISADSKGDIWVADTGNNRIEEFSPEGAYIAAYGTLGTGNGQFSKPQGVAVDSEGNVWVADTGNNRIQVLSSTGVYIQQFGAAGSGAGQMKEPTDVTTDTSHHVYVLDAGNGRVQTWLNEGEAEYAPSAHGSLTVYYTTAANSKYSLCGGHPEWANLPCEALPSAQPETSGVPSLPTTLHTYNMYDEPTSTTSTVGTSTRTTTVTYDEAGRNTSSETTSNVGEALPKVNEKYSETNGALLEQYTATESLKSAYNTIGQLTSYTDADGNVTTYEYENGGDARLTHRNDGKGTQTYTYDTTTGAVKELSDSAAGTFTASYDTEGNLVSENYPNAMSANFTINTAGQATGLQYVKNVDCATTCPETWYSDTVVPSIHGQWLSQQSTQAAQTYTYDQVGRVTQVQDTPAGKGCVTRLYLYDEETNRTSTTTREPGAGGACATEGGSTESHTYDPANRLLDTGVSYDSFGNTAKLPASDGGGSELTSGFYNDSQLQSEAQNGQTITYKLDPASRDREVISTGKVTATEIQHFAEPNSTTPSWTGELSSNYMRNVPGISGTLAGIQHNSEKPVLQVTNLHGDIVATATDSETATGLASTIKEASEYGVPATEAPPKNSWLGAHEIPTTLPAGAMAMGARSYIPQLGRYLQTDPVHGGSANAYSYVAGDPVNTTDLRGAYTWGFGGALAESLNAHGAELAAAYEAEVRAEAERLAAEAAEEAEMWASLEAAMPEEEWGEEEGLEEEYAAFRAGSGHSAQPIQTAVGGVFYQDRSREEAESKKYSKVRSLIHLCEQRVGKAACASYVGFFGWLKKEVKARWNWIKKAAKTSWNTIKYSVLNTFRVLGYQDIGCYKSKCLVLAVETTATIYDGFKCVREDDCEGFSQDISEVEI